MLLSKPVPLVLDLDGTLIRTDTFHEMMVRLLIQKPWRLLALPFWFLKGRAYTKSRLVEEVSLSPDHLPFNPHILAYAREESKKGRPVILATGSDQRIAQGIADHVGIFQEVIGSDGAINMTGPHKKNALFNRFGDKGFDYAGDSIIDMHVWSAARMAIVVHPKKGVLKGALALKGEENTHYFPREKSRASSLLLAFRPLFWVCNLFAPSWTFFLGFSLLASGLLIAGDLLTLYKEREGSYKKSIFADGHLHLITAFLLSPCLVFISLFLISSPIVFLIYIPLFLILDAVTRPLAQGLRWGLLSLFQILSLLSI